jgi:hypothetical protein
MQVLVNGTIMLDPNIRIPQLDDGDILIVERMSDGRIVLKKIEGANGKFG